jgi:hypothetical protein
LWFPLPGLSFIGVLLAMFLGASMASASSVPFVSGMTECLQCVRSRGGGIPTVLPSAGRKNLKARRVKTGRLCAR